MARLAALALPALLNGPATARAADAVHVGNSAATSFTFLVADIGAAKGMFAAKGLDVTVTALGGDAKVQQALAAGSIDFGLGSGPAMAFVAKGAPVIAVAAFAGAPRSISVVVADDSPLHSPAELKGKLLAISTPGSLTEWLTKRLSNHEGWGSDGVKTVAVGAGSAMVSALLSKQVDGFMGSTESGLGLEARHAGRILVGMEKYAPDFIDHVIFARKEIVRDQPDKIRRFLAGFLDAVDFMIHDRAATIALAGKLLNEEPERMARVYDLEISMLIPDGRFEPKAVAVLKDSFVELGMLPERPKDDKLFTTAFLPDVHGSH
jgi:ABC-type nitrate/sulfonate/bicarbonate transport system substrate-binding protein